MYKMKKCKSLKIKKKDHNCPLGCVRISNMLRLLKLSNVKTKTQ